MAQGETILLARAALGYAAKGYRVVPLYPGQKRPHGLLAPHGLRGATADPATIRAWWAREPRAGVGLLAPEGVLVLDVDTPEVWERLRGEYPTLEEAPRQRTPRGGVHVFLRLPPGLEGVLSAAVRRLEGVDLRGMAKAYLAAWPTRLSNGTYYWEVPLRRPEELPLAPPRLLQRLLPPPPPPPREVVLGASRPSASPSRLRGLLDLSLIHISEPTRPY